LILDKITLTGPKTKQLAAVLDKFGTTSAVVVDAENANVKLSARNLPRAKYLVPDALNVYDILGHEKLLVTKAAIDAIVKKARGAAEAAA